MPVPVMITEITYLIHDRMNNFALKIQRLSKSDDASSPSTVLLLMKTKSMAVLGTVLSAVFLISQVILEMIISYNSCVCCCYRGIFTVLTSI